VRVGRVADAVKLQVGIAQASFRCLLRKLKALGEFMPFVAACTEL